MDCHGVRAAMFKVTDNEVEPELLVVFRQHLTACPACAEQFAYVSHLLALVREHSGRYSAPQTLKVRILASFPHRGGARREYLE